MKRMGIAMAAFAVIGVMTGCGTTSGSPSNSTSATNSGTNATAVSGGKTYRIAVIPKAVGFDYWETVHAGAEAAAKDLGNVSIVWKGTSAETDINGQISMIEDFINQHVDALVVAATDAKALVPVLQQAQKSGIKVITIDSGTDPQVSDSFVATDNVHAAAEAADEMNKLLGGKGDVALIPFVPGASTSNQREQGFKDELGKYPGLHLVATQYSQSDYNKALSVTEDILTSHPNLAGIFAANEPGALGAAQAVKERGLQGKVQIIGFDAAPKEIQALQEGTIQALIVQNPYKIGYDGVQEAVADLEGKKVDPRVDTGATVVTKDNMNDPEIQKLLYPLGKK
ncbi:ABC transporter substrate-binding protein [Alicyclobacillus macrosporangiidus]|jgi:ribose transport system substrate-binding protein|uniref:Ribose transport system substrate-binding protein n=1 Tax=Alicyclobacillus macrosporangiidus TaxID=392015 RepID=A0A1I7JHS2_9BACL|nr:ABC transporter substrate-binding protein [Alicyclobacillus macrosporangiidus]SFU84749.1 ribose transport system substrate-binding protein [Alicyclobacillus macrosporangiidus]